jgi:spore coat polysaccharide biosynthesis protein SpsF (cytidylyltransferase family)
MTGILFIARLGSERLSNKHLIEASGKTFIEWLVARYADEFKNEIETGQVKLIIATSVRPENKQFETVLKDYPVSVFYGDDEHIPLRQVNCAEKFELKNIISIDGDDILCSTAAAKKIYHELNYSFKPLVKSIGLPFGMNSIGYSLDCLKNSIAVNQRKVETGWGRIFNNNLMGEINLGNYANNKELRFTLDYNQDADFFKAIISYFGLKIISLKDSDLISAVISQRFFKINQSLHEQYWNNFNAQKDLEDI